MSMNKKEKFRIVIIIQLILLSGFLLSIILKNTLTPIFLIIHNMYIGFGILFVIKKDGKFRENWVLLAYVIFVTTIINIFSYIYNLIASNIIEESSLYMMIYLIPSLILLGSAVIYFKRSYKRWHRKQLIIDIGMFFVLTIGMFNDLFFLKDTWKYTRHLESVLIFVSLSIDTFIIVVILTMTFSLKAKIAWKHISFVSLGYLLYVIANLIYIDYRLNDIHHLWGGYQIVFIAGFISFFYAAIFKEKNRHLLAAVIETKEPDNFGRSQNAWLIIIVPFFLYLFGRFTVAQIAFFLLVIMIYQIVSISIQKLYMTQILLQKEMDMKNKLELMVIERTDLLVEANRKLELKSNLDYLTKLYNRSGFLEFVEKKIEIKEAFSILFLDLDRFKVINDLYGHPVGDQVLVIIAKRFQERLNLPKIVARFGGDEFAILVKSIDIEEITNVAKTIIDVINEQIIVDSLQFNVNTSIGISKYPEDGTTTAELLKHADIAMYHAKEQHLAKKYVHYTSEFKQKIERRNHIEWLLRNCQYDDEFELYYQPQFKVEEEQLVGMEALLRWKHPEEGFIGPDEFIPIAEEIGFIVPISLWVFEKAITQIKIWHEKYNAELIMGMNLSPASLNVTDFFESVQKLIIEIGVSPEYLDFEITENSAMNMSNVMGDIFKRLCDMGVIISIDDFGTGYSSLSYLKRFKVHRLKIAKELIDNIEYEQDELQIVKAIILMCEGLGIRKIAEGVETKEQLALLKSLKCEAIQGYIFGRPVPAIDFEKKYLEVQR